MIIVNPSDLEQQGISWRASAAITLKDKLFEIGASFPKRIFQRVVDQLQQEQVADGAEFLILDIGEHFTVWHEVISAPTAVIAPFTTVDLPLDRQLDDQQPRPADRSLESTHANRLNQSDSVAIAPTHSTEPDQPDQEAKPPFTASVHNMIYRGAKYQQTP